MKILVLASNYASIDNPAALTYIHSRNVMYKEKYGIEVDVLNFSANQTYIIDGVNVITLDYFRKEKSKYDLLISHAPNIRNHYLFILKYQRKFPKIVFFFHGHEVLIQSKVYSKPYWYVKTSTLKNILQDLYDYFKTFVWHITLKRLAYKSQFVFVSKWMHEEFIKAVKLTDSDLQNHVYITYNSIGHFFEINKYNADTEKIYDYITIRSVLDGSKYAVDLVVEIAKHNPEKKFLIIGKGDFFDHIKQPSNMTWISKHCNHKELAEYINKSRCALMPTRTDAQGVMACEMASYGIPLITSDIDVCHEVFSDFNNVAYMQNGLTQIDIDNLYEKIKNKESCDKYYIRNTIKQEIKIFKEAI